MKTNHLVFTDTRIIGNEKLTVKICLTDECKNGHQDFSITGNLYERRNDSYKWVAGGCLHNEILRFFPQYKMFVDLHLCDYSGAPMHAVANMHYHMKEGKFNSNDRKEKPFKEEFCKYYRITSLQFDELKKAQNKTHFAIILQDLSIPQQWKKEANRAIKALEGLTGNEFLNDSERSQLIMPSEKEMKEEKEKIKNGYYSKENKQKRAKKADKDALKAIEKEMKEECDKTIKKVERKYFAQKALIQAGGVEAYKNHLYYDHTDTLALNWRGYDHLSEETIEEIVSNIQLPDGVTLKVNDKEVTVKKT